MFDIFLLNLVKLQQVEDSVQVVFSFFCRFVVQHVEANEACVLASGVVRYKKKWAGSSISATNTANFRQRRSWVIEIQLCSLTFLK